jgi:hypothetical protein
MILMIWILFARNHRIRVRINSFWTPDIFCPGLFKKKSFEARICHDMNFLRKRSWPFISYAATSTSRFFLRLRESLNDLMGAELLRWSLLEIINLTILRMRRIPSISVLARRYASSPEIDIENWITLSLSCLYLEWMVGAHTLTPSQRTNHEVRLCQRDVESR